MNGGDDYELLFTIPADKLTEFKFLLTSQPEFSELACHDIGKITEQAQNSDEKKTSESTIPSILFTHLQQPVDLNSTGWDHFK